MRPATERNPQIVAKGADIGALATLNPQHSHGVSTPGMISTGEGDVSATITINQTAVNDINVDELRKSLDELYEALGASNLESSVKQEAQAATFQAKKEGIKDGKVDGTGLATNLEEVGKTLEKANTVVEEGSTLWNSIKKVAKTVGPIVVGGLKLAALVV